MGTVSACISFVFLLLSCYPGTSLSGGLNGDVNQDPPNPKDLCLANTQYFEQQLDHFGFSDQRTFQQRYLLADHHWTGEDGPILFFMGNELDIEVLCRNSGFLWEIAPEFGAMVVYAEHRYYGKTLPLGPDTLKNVSNFNWLTTEQALADYAILITHLKATIPSASNSPVIAIGGSYGGMLTAYMRIVYPQVVIGGLASSAPIFMFSGIGKCNATLDQVSHVFEKSSLTCAKNIRRSFNIVQRMALAAKGRDFISRTFHLCKPVTDVKDVLAIQLMLGQTLYYYALMNYPYPSEFVIPLPGSPVHAACGLISKPLHGKDTLLGMAKILNLFYNHTGDLQCLDHNNPPGNLEIYQWTYQMCTEMPWPMCSDGSGVFPKFPWSWKVWSEVCYSSYKVRPRPYWLLLQYRLTALDLASNIIFTNGEIDPIYSGGVLSNVSDSVIAISIENAAHQLDLAASNELDPQSVRVARERIKTIFRNWLKL